MGGTGADGKGRGGGRGGWICRGGQRRRLVGRTSRQGAQRGGCRRPRGSGPGLAPRVVRHVERDSGCFVVWHVEVPTVPRLSPNYKTNAVHSRNYPISGCSASRRPSSTFHRIVCPPLPFRSNHPPPSSSHRDPQRVWCLSDKG